MVRLGVHLVGMTTTIVFAVGLMSLRNNLSYGDRSTAKDFSPLGYALITATAFVGVVFYARWYRTR
jgi:hypothetical protein